MDNYRLPHKQYRLQDRGHTNPILRCFQHAGKMPEIMEKLRTLLVNIFGCGCVAFIVLTLKKS